MSSKIVGHEADSVDPLFLMPSHAGRHVQFDGFDGETGAEALFCGGHSC